MYSATILDHIDNPRNVGVIPDAAAFGCAHNPVCGDRLDLYLSLEADHIVAASFQAQACPPCIAAASVLTEKLIGQPLTTVIQWQPEFLTQALEFIPRNKAHCPVLALDALQAAYQDYQNKKSNE